MGSIPTAPVSYLFAGVAELADAHDSKSCSFWSVGSTPTTGIVKRFNINALPYMARRFYFAYTHDFSRKNSVHIIVCGGVTSWLNVEVTNLLLIN